MDQEQWRTVAEFPDYEISSHGRLRSNKFRYCGQTEPTILQPQIGTTGYCQTGLLGPNGQKTRKFHLLVAAAFLPPKPTAAHQINHIDGVKINNRAANLEWVTPSENSKHAFALGLRHLNGEANPAHKLTANQVLEIRNRKDAGATTTELAADYGVAKVTIKNICARRIWRHI